MAVDLPLEPATETARVDQMPTQHLNAERRFGFQYEPFSMDQWRVGS
ncbi:hypothetical protein ABID26_001717 [Mesorhizobium shonense]|uniref:Uncharacterized protein n=1 Tax=Mesorhizobium shonense TaxID=1209948 RepID=A0ABV2HP28_9HYPH